MHNEIFTNKLSFSTTPFSSKHLNELNLAPMVKHMPRVRPGNPKMAGPKLITFLINVLSIFHKNISMQKCHLHAKKIENVSKILGKITKTAIKFSIQLDTF